MSTCGRGTQSRRCELNANNLLGEKGPGSLKYNDLRFHDRSIYVQATTIGQKSCKVPDNLVKNVKPKDSTTADDPWYQATDTPDVQLRVCSDGGEGSVRLPLQVPYQWGLASGSQNAQSHKFEYMVHYDFICPYGSQPGVCPDRDLTLFRSAQDELEQPTGPQFSECSHAGVADFECCRSEHAFRIHGGSGIVGNRLAEDENYCAYPEETRSLRRYVKILSTPLPGVHIQEHCPVQNMERDEDNNWPLEDLAGNIASSVEECAARCSALNTAGTDILGADGKPTDPPSWKGETVDCVGFQIKSISEDIFEEQVRCLLFSKPDYWNCGPNIGGDWYARSPSLLEDGSACPLHWTSYHHTPTGCKDYCAAAHQREGNDDTCMPGKPECANWLDGPSFPHEYITVNAWCICGAKLFSEVVPGKYVDRGTINEHFDSSARKMTENTRRIQELAKTRVRNLHEDLAGRGEPGFSANWEWPDPLGSTITEHHGDHFDVDRSCFTEITHFLTKHIPSTASCASYMNMSAPPLDLVDLGFDPSAPNGHSYCAEQLTEEDACCVAHRGAAEASRMWLQSLDMTTPSVSESFGSSVIVGTAVHTSRVATVGNFVSYLCNTQTLIYNQFHITCIYITGQ